MDPFKILGIPSGSTQDEIKKAFRRKAHEHHPDKGGDPAKFKEVQKAYEQCLRGGGTETVGKSTYHGFNDAYYDELLRAFKTSQKNRTYRFYGDWSWVNGDEETEKANDDFKKNLKSALDALEALRRKMNDV